MSSRLQRDVGLQGRSVHRVNSHTVDKYLQRRHLVAVGGTCAHVHRRGDGSIVQGGANCDRRIHRAGSASDPGSARSSGWSPRSASCVPVQSPYYAPSPLCWRRLRAMCAGYGRIQARIACPRQSFSFSFSACASLSKERSGSACFQIDRKSWYVRRDVGLSPLMA